MKPPWIEAGGEFQIPFMLAAGKLLKGADVACPKCAAPHLRHYFHAFDRIAGHGSFWVWCDACRTHTHLPRVQAPALHPTDPYAELSLEDFAALEMDASIGFLDRLNGLWESGALAAPEPAPAADGKRP
jgi:hypothetical protein